MIVLDCSHFYPKFQLRNLGLQFSLLSDKIHRFNRAIIELADPDSRRYYYTRLFAFAFTQTLSGQHHSRLLRFLLTLMVWISAIWLPLAVLIGLQVGFLAYHDEDILFWQRVAVMLDLLVLLIFWPMIRSTDSRWRSWIRQAVGLPWLMQKIRSILGYFRQKVTDQHTTAAPSKEQIHHANGYPLLEGSVSAITGLCVIAFVWGIAVLPDSKHEVWVAKNIIPENWKTCSPLSLQNEGGQRYFRLTEFLFDGRQLVEGEECETKNLLNIFNRNLIIREQLLIANELKAEDEADLISTDESIHQAALKKVTGLVLSGRDLRYANFSGARLPKVNFVGADKKSSDLSYTNFNRAMLIKAIMNETKLQEADLTDAQFQKADLTDAQLQGAKMKGVQLQGTILYRTKLQGVDLTNAQLQEADLYGAKLQGANLRGAQFQRAKLYDAYFQGANLRSAQLQGADLRNAQLQGANLSGAKLQGAILSQANLSYSDITGAEFGWLTQQTLEILQISLADSTQDEKLLKRINDTLTQRTQEQPAIFSASGKAIREDSNQWDRPRLYGFWNGLEAAENETDYQNKLAAYLIELSCQNRWTATGIARHRIKASGFDKPISLASTVAQCLLSLKDQKNKAEQLVCPALSEIDKATVALLEREAARKNNDRPIQSTFSCQTNLSDQPQSSK